MKRRPGAGSREPEARLEPVTTALQAYADRGVFRGFRATPSTRGRVEYGFLWLTRKPIAAVFDAPRRRLTFPSLFPGIDPATAAELRAMVASRTARTLPDHKRVDGRKARLTAAIRTGALSLTVDIRGGNHDYAVKKALNLVNELFLFLHETHPEYLVVRFGISTE